MARTDQLRTYDAANLRAAELIAADPDRYAGLPLLWARLFLDRWRRSAQQRRHLLERAA